MGDDERRVISFDDIPPELRDSAWVNAVVAAMLDVMCEESLLLKYFPITKVEPKEEG